MQDWNRVWTDLQLAHPYLIPDCRSQATPPKIKKRRMSGVPWPSPASSHSTDNTNLLSLCTSSNMPNTVSGSQNGSLKKENVDNVHIPSHPILSPNVLINHNHVFLFIPNLIGYTRIILAASSLYYMRWHPKYCTWLYIVSCLLDAFDGMAARRFGQSIPSPNCWNVVADSVA